MKNKQVTKMLAILVNFRNIDLAIRLFTYMFDIYIVMKI